jgi:hypothetical protein
MEDVSAQKEPSSMDLNVSINLLIDVLVLKIPTGTELTVSAILDSKVMETPVSVMVSLWETIVKGVHPSQIPSLKTEFVNVTMGTLN